MSGIFGGGGQTISTSDTPVSNFRVQTSLYGLPIPIIYGRTRVPINLLGYYDFKAIPHTTSSSASGGKGGGGGATTEHTSFTYQASIMLGIGEGPISSINAYWNDKTYNGNIAAFTAFLGTYTQSAWSYLTTNHPSEALNYRGQAYLAGANYDLGASASLGNHTVDVTGRLPYNPGTINGADPKALVEDFLTNTDYGCLFPSGYIGSWNQYSDFCRASGIFLSPEYSTQNEARQTINDLMHLTNSGIFFSDGVLKITPFSDTSVTGNGITYTPYNVVQYAFDDDDFLDEDEPIRLLRTPNADAYNQISVEFLDKDNEYNPSVVSAEDALSVDLYDLRPSPETIKAHGITDAATARLVAQLILQRILYSRNVYEFVVGLKYSRLEPCDYVTLTDSRLGLSSATVRVLSIEETDDGRLNIQAEDAPAGVLDSPLYDAPAGSGYSVDYGAAPGNVVTPQFFEVPAIRAISGLAIAAAVTGNSTEWGGCEIWVSNDGTNYAFMDKVMGGARYGTITNSITDAVGQVARASLVGNGGQMLSGSTADANALSTLCLIENEYMAHSTAALISTNVYDLTMAVRGVYYTNAASHASSSRFVRVDDAIAYSKDLDLEYVGKTLYFKFLSFNKFGGGKQQLADVSAYTYTITGSMVQLPPPSLSGFTATAGQNSIFLNWTNPANANTKRVEIFKNSTNDVGTATFLAAISGPVGFYADYIGSSGVARYYWIRTINQQEYPSSFLGPQNATTGDVSAVPGDGTVTHAKMAADAIWAANILAGEIGANHLAANSVVAGKIAASAITAGGGEIANLAVSTLKIQDNAITIPVGAYNGSNQSFGAGIAPSGGTFLTISAGITSGGGPIQVAVAGSNNNNRGLGLRIVRDGTVIAYQPYSVAAASYGTFAMNVQDTPGAGSHTYYAYLVNNSANYCTGSVQGVGMTLLEVKK